MAQSPEVSVFISTPQPLIEYARLIADVVPCTRSATLSKRTWWGMQEFFFCEACHRECEKGTFFAPDFTWQGRPSPSGRCDMYTANVRRRYALAYGARSLGDFTAFCKERKEYYQMHLKDMKRQAELRAISQGAAGHNVRTNLTMQTTAAQYSGIEWMYWAHASNNVMQAHTNLIIGVGKNDAGPAVHRIAAGWLAREWSQAELNMVSGSTVVCKSPTQVSSH
jgi:hypothetical protein